MTVLLSSAAPKLPSSLRSPIEGSELTLESFRGTDKELTELHMILSDQRLWEGGYDLSGRILDIGNKPLLWCAMEELWLADGLDLMVILHRGSFAGITGVIRVSSDDGTCWTALTGRTVLNPDLWGSSANTESKLMIYGELFRQGVSSIECSISCTNMRSIAAVSKFGLRELRRSSKPVDGQDKEFIYFGIDGHEWGSVSQQNIDRIAKN